MFISIRKYKTSDRAEVARRVKGQFLERVSKVPGFRGYYLVDIGDSYHHPGALRPASTDPSGCPRQPLRIAPDSQIRVFRQMRLATKSPLPKPIRLVSWPARGR